MVQTQEELLEYFEAEKFKFKEDFDAIKDLIKMSSDEECEKIAEYLNIYMGEIASILQHCWKKID